MTNTNYKDTHGVVIQGNNIMITKSDKLTLSQQLKVVEDCLIEHYNELTKNSLVSLNTTYEISVYENGKLVETFYQSYTNELLQSIKRINKKITK